MKNEGLRISAEPLTAPVSSFIPHPSSFRRYELTDQTLSGLFDFVAALVVGWEREVIVEIPEEVVAYAERITRRQLPPENSFWTYRAEHTLATYLWNEGRLPDHRLRVIELTPQELDAAARWEIDNVSAAKSTS